MVQREDDGERRRRRVRGVRPGLPNPAGSSTAESCQAEPSLAESDSVRHVAAARPAPFVERPADPRRRRPDAERLREPYDSHVPVVADDHERGLRGLIGGGSSQVSVTAAMRARDAARPTEADLARAEETLTIVHRGWVPRDT